jgi:formamidopyrimidine-DNA glycosylase
MTVAHGNYTLYTSKKLTLGEDPLRPDANPDQLYNKVIKSKKSIGQLIMDQSYFAGPGNIYRAEILFLAGVYPTTLGTNLDKVTFDRIWNVSVQLLRRGYDTGSILTVDARLIRRWLRKENGGISIIKVVVEGVGVK